MIRRHHWKERLKINKTAKFERTICWKLTKIYSSPQKREILETFGIVCLGGGGVGGVTNLSHTIQTSVNFRKIAELYLHLKFHFQI